MQYTECGVQQNINRFTLNFPTYEGIKHCQPANVGHNSRLKGQGQEVSAADATQCYTDCRRSHGTS
jgi:hypothetical protein